MFDGAVMQWWRGGMVEKVMVKWRDGGGMEWWNR